MGVDQGQRLGVECAAVEQGEPEHAWVGVVTCGRRRRIEELDDAWTLGADPCDGPSPALVHQDLDELPAAPGGQVGKGPRCDDGDRGGGREGVEDAAEVGDHVPGDDGRTVPAGQLDGCRGAREPARPWLRACWPPWARIALGSPSLWRSVATPALPQ